MKTSYSVDYVAKDARAPSGWRGIGSQIVDTLPKGRKTCSEGREDFILTEDIELHLGHKLVTVKASPKKPIVGYTIIFPIGGDTGWVHPMDRKPASSSTAA